MRGKDLELLPMRMSHTFLLGLLTLFLQIWTRPDVNNRQSKARWSTTYKAPWYRGSEVIQIKLLLNLCLSSVQRVNVQFACTSDAEQYIRTTSSKCYRFRGCHDFRPKFRFRVVWLFMSSAFSAKYVAFCYVPPTGSPSIVLGAWCIQKSP